MIYKIESADDESNTLDMSPLINREIGIGINQNGERCFIHINKGQLYDLIGALITVQQKLKNLK